MSIFTFSFKKRSTTEGLARLGYIAEAAALNDVFVAGNQSPHCFAAALLTPTPIPSIFDFANMRRASSSLNHGSGGNFYSASLTPTCSSGSGSRASSVGNQLDRSSSSSGRSSDSTPLSSRENRETMQQVISGLTACQRTIEELLQSVKSSNERIEQLTDKVNALDDKVMALSTSDLEEADQCSSGHAKKRKRPKSSLVVQVSILLIF